MITSERVPARDAVKLVIYGEPASKANSRKIVTIRGRPASIKSDKALDYARSALLQIPRSARIEITGRVRVTMTIYYKTERPDLDESLILDLLQNQHAGTGKERRVIQRGVYANDRQVREKLIYHGIDKKNPRAEIEVLALEPNQSTLGA